MKFIEIASAEEQLALWKLVNESVWTAIQQQSADERTQSRAESEPQAKVEGEARAGRPAFTSEANHVQTASKGEATRSACSSASSGSAAAEPKHEGAATNQLEFGSKDG